MITQQSGTSRRIVRLLISAAFFTLLCSPALAGGYDNALKGVNSYDAVYEVTQPSPKVSNIVFWAIKNSYEVAEVKGLAKEPRIAVVFHGPAVKLLSSNKEPFSDEELVEVEKFQNTLRQMKKDGINLEVCLYAVKMMGVDKATIIPEIDQVGNGFVSVIGYHMQGYAVVRIP